MRKTSITMGLVIATILIAYISALSLSNEALAHDDDGPNVIGGGSLPNGLRGINVIKAGDVTVAGTLFVDEQEQVHAHVAGAETHIGTASEGQQGSHPGLGCNIGDPHC